MEFQNLKKMHALILFKDYHGKFDLRYLNCGPPKDI